MRFSIFGELITEAFPISCCMTIARLELFSTFILLFLKNEDEFMSEPDKLLQWGAS